MHKAKLKKAVRILTETFPKIKGICIGEDGDSIHLGDVAEGGVIDVGDPEHGSFELPGADYYNEFNATTYENFGVHTRLHEKLTELGLFAEWHDPGTLFAYGV